MAGWSSTADVQSLQRGDHDPAVRGFTVPNAEITLDGAVDPYFKGFVNIVYKMDPEGESATELEEAYVLTTSLPSNLQLKVGQFFTMDVITCRASGTVEAIVVDAQMPAHGHGMNYRPTATQPAPSHFQVSGLMLHMPGRWRLIVDLVQADRRTRLEHDIDLKP